MAKPYKKRARKATAGTNRRRRRPPVPNHRRRTTGRPNATRIVVVAPRRNKRSASRNPQFFGQQIRSVDMVKYVAGGLLGVTAVKMVVPMLPSTLTSSTTMKLVTSVAAAVAAGWVASRLSPQFGSAVLFGALMQAGSVIINTVIPSASSFALSGGRGVGTFMPASFPIPQTPIQIPASYATAGRSNRGYGGAKY